MLIFAIGILLNWFPFCFYDGNELVVKTWSVASINAKGETMGIRFWGVLQRIALTYFLASIIVKFCKVRGAFYVGLLLLLGYWFLCVAANPTDAYSLQGWFGTSIDRALVGDKHMYHGEGVAFDPEGLFNSFAAIVQVVFGYLIGYYILQKGKTAEMLNGLFVVGFVMVCNGLFRGMFMPINKKIWTSSYTIYTTGLATLILGVLMYVIEIKQKKGIWSRFFDVFGKNALFIFVLSGILPRLLGLIRIKSFVDEVGKQHFLSPLSWFYENICKPIFVNQPKFGSLIYALCFIGMMWFFAWFLDKKKIYIKV